MSFFGMSGAAGPGSQAVPKLVERGMKVCWSQTHSVAVPKVVRDGQPDYDAVRANARPIWEAEVANKFGAEWNWDISIVNDGALAVCGEQSAHCDVSLAPCKPRPIECKETPHEVEAGFELLPGVDDSMRYNIVSSVKSDLKERWRFEVLGKFGPEWAATARNDFETLRSFKRPIDEGCKGQMLEGGRLSYQCRFATAPCKEPPPLDGAGAHRGGQAADPPQPAGGGRR